MSRCLSMIVAGPSTEAFRPHHVLRLTTKSCFRSDKSVLGSSTGPLLSSSAFKTSTCPPAPPLRTPQRGDGHQVAVLELGAAAPAGVCAGYGALPVVSARDPAAPRRHHAG